MEHIRQFDWCTSFPDTQFLLEEDLDNSATEKILRNKFRDPLVSDSEDEEPRPSINWDEVFKKKKQDDRKSQMYIPGLRSLPPYPKLSALTEQQHYQCLKVLCAENPLVLELDFIPRPTKSDYKVFEEVKELYAQEQQEYIEWAKSLWVNGLCVRALSPKPPIEIVYEAEFKMKANAMQSFPKSYEVVAQISLEAKQNHTFDMLLKKELVKVNINTLPQIKVPELCQKRFTIMRTCSVPTPCSKHPSRLVLPTEKCMSTLPLAEVFAKLAQYGCEHGAEFVCSEGALRCLADCQAAWCLPLAVCRAVDAAGESKDVLVLGSEVPAMPHSAPERTYRAFRHLLGDALVPASEKARLLKMAAAGNVDDGHDNVHRDVGQHHDVSQHDDLSDDDDQHLFIDEAAFGVETCGPEEMDLETPTRSTPAAQDQSGVNESVDSLHTCTCKGTIFEYTPPRSYRKFGLRNASSGEELDLIVHCAHKYRDKSGEVIVEPVPEYLVDMGGSEPTRLPGLALGLALRSRAHLLTGRVDAATGDVVRLEAGGAGAEGARAQALAAVHVALAQLRGLLPARYLLCHEPSHGRNALLYAAAGAAGGTAGGALRPAWEAPRAVDEAAAARVPPTLVPVLLPMHKFHKMLPCAFSPRAQHVRRENRRPPPARRRTPPHALTWPKKRGRKKKNSV